MASTRATDGSADWAERAADRSPAVHRSRARTKQQSTVIVEAARRLIAEKGTSFTTSDLAKESGVALQTFYRHFSSKDHLLLAVFEDVIAEQIAQIAEVVAELPGPVERLHRLVAMALDAVRRTDAGISPQFMTSEHWRLHQLFPHEMALANKPFADLVESQLREAQAEGLLDPPDPAGDAWLVMKLVMSVFHHYAFVEDADEADAEAMADRLWAFCLAAFRPVR